MKKEVKNMKKTIISIGMIMTLVLVTVTAGATYSVPNETTSIGGQVTGSDGKPVSGALVLACSSYGIEYAFSDDSGQYVLYNIPIFEDIEILCFKEHYKAFRTSVYIDMIGVCLVLNIELQKKNNIIEENSIVNCNTQSMIKI
jgi:hypothetical protein